MEISKRISKNKNQIRIPSVMSKYLPNQLNVRVNMAPLFGTIVTKVWYARELWKNSGFKNKMQKVQKKDMECERYKFILKIRRIIQEFK